MNRKKSLLLGLAVLALMAFSCSSGIKFPAVTDTPTGKHNPGQFVWHDLASSNPQSAIAFYTAVFGWEIETLGEGDMAYHVIKNKGKAIGGIFKLAEKYGNTSAWISSISVLDVDEAVKLNAEAGGTTVFKKANFNGRGQTALVQDPQGALIAFLHSENGDPAIEKNENEIALNGWLWNELWTTDLQASLDYYQNLVTYNPKKMDDSKVPYYTFNNNNVPLAGVLGNPVEGARSSWMPYIKVDDVNVAVEKAKKAGAHVMMEPTPEIRKGSVAVLSDPSGGQFTIQQWFLK